VEGDGALPRLISGARLGDPPALVVPAGGAVPAACRRRDGLLERAAACGRIAVAEVALGDRAVLTALRTVPIDEAL
jgi:hypothetical protein